MELDLTPFVDRVAAVDTAGLDQAGAQELLVSLQVAVGRLTGIRDRVLGELHAAGQGQVLASAEGPPLYRSLQSWWRDAALVPGQQAGAEVRRAAVLHDLPLVRDAVVSGALQPGQAAVLTRLHGTIDQAGLVESQAHLVPVVAPLATDALSRWVAHQIATHCEPALDAEDRAAEGKRYLQLTTEADGTVRGRFVLTREQAESVHTVLEPLARRQGLEDHRTAGQRRADALVDVFDSAARWMDLPDAGGRRPQVSYVTTAEWSAREMAPGFAQRIAEACAGTGAHPLAMQRYAAVGAWTGPQTRARIEAVLCDAQVSRVLLDSSGTVLSLESVSDAITAAQRKAVSARDRHCIAKGCTRPPSMCDVHHLLHREHGGATTIENLGLLCRRHHVLWHKGKVGWRDLHLPWLPDPDDPDHPQWRTDDPPGSDPPLFDVA